MQTTSVLFNVVWLINLYWSLISKHICIIICLSLIHFRFLLMSCLFSRFFGWVILAYRLLFGLLYGFQNRKHTVKYCSKVMDVKFKIAVLLIFFFFDMLLLSLYCLSKFYDMVFLFWFHHLFA